MVLSAIRSLCALRWCLPEQCERMRGMTSLVDRLERKLYAVATAHPRDSANRRRGQRLDAAYDALNAAAGSADRR